MGTNFYVVLPEADEVKTVRKAIESLSLENRDLYDTIADALDEHRRVHIGKSCSGWCFLLHVVPERNLMNWEQWKAFLASASIVDEYGHAWAFEGMVQTVERRNGPLQCGAPESIQRLYGACAEWGPNGLVRNMVDGHHCIGHGRTWDLITGKFN